jgi:hypothetical protein
VSSSTTDILDAGADPTAVTDWIAQTQADCAAPGRAHHDPGRAPPDEPNRDHRPGGKRRTDAHDKAEVHRQLGLRLDYSPETETVRAEINLSAHCGVLVCDRGGLEPPHVAPMPQGTYARHNGTAPLPVWSSNRARHRLSRTDNRQLNAALHRIAMTQARCHQPAKDLITRRRAGGDGGLEALRVLKRRLSDVVYQALRMDCAPTG